jgi:hypothetical protein
MAPNLTEPVREGAVNGSQLRLRMTLTSPDAPDFEHVVEQTIELG